VAETRATIPDREQFKAAEVCEIAGVQPYVLRSWELEFPSIGTSRSAGGPRVYRRADVERILRIKDLVFSEGLTLAGARRRIEEEDAPADVETPRPTLDAGARERLGQIKDGLRALLNMLEGVPAQKAGGWPPAAKPGVLEFDAAEPAAEVPGAAPKKGAKKKPAKS
jgi:DNA-binding transcriptional MerR regulator